MAFDIHDLLNEDVYDHPVLSFELIETHISWIILTGNYAYKVKKPVNFGFLDFSTLENRFHCCKEEIRLNRRLAPEIYLSVVAITKKQGKLSISADMHSAVEYAVKMVQFPQEAQLDILLESGKLTIEVVSEIARKIASFHLQADVASVTDDFGDLITIFKPVKENFTQIYDHPGNNQYTSSLNKLEQWSHSTHDKLSTVFKHRKAAGFIRECHGDLHLRNLIWLNNEPMAFDCIEFNEHLRWIDAISDIAFLVMDLQHKNKYEFSHRLLNTYLEVTGDYAGLVILPFYLCYRAMVRAKVDVLRLSQNEILSGEDEALHTELASYLALADSYTQSHSPALILMHGISASGKSTISQALVDAMGAIRLRSDVERKRIFDVHSKENQTNNVNQGIYSKDATHATYEKLSELAVNILNAGYTVIVDASFLSHSNRQYFYQLADTTAVSCIIIHTSASDDTLRHRISTRNQGVSDANLDVMEHQMANYRGLREDEFLNTVTINTETALDIQSVIQQIKSLNKH